MKDRVVLGVLELSDTMLSLAENLTPLEVVLALSVVTKNATVALALTTKDTTIAEKEKFEHAYPAKALQVQDMIFKDFTSQTKAVSALYEWAAALAESIEQTIAAITKDSTEVAKNE